LHGFAALSFDLGYIDGFGLVKPPADICLVET